MCQDRFPGLSRSWGWWKLLFVHDHLPRACPRREICRDHEFRVDSLWILFIARPNTWRSDKQVIDLEMGISLEVSARLTRSISHLTSFECTCWSLSRGDCDRVFTHRFSISRTEGPQGSQNSSNIAKVNFWSGGLPRNLFTSWCDFAARGCIHRSWERLSMEISIRDNIIDSVGDHVDMFSWLGKKGHICHQRHGTGFPLEIRAKSCLGWNVTVRYETGSLGLRRMLIRSQKRPVPWWPLVCLYFSASSKVSSRQ